MMMQVWKSTTQLSLSNGQLHPDAIKFTDDILLLR
jgi:hypothetical protein